MIQTSKKVIVKLRKTGSQKIVCWFLIRKGQSHQTRIPVGQYQITLASGGAWYGEKYLFGTNASYSAINQPITIPKRTHVTISMTPSPQGTINEHAIAADEF